MTVGRSTWTRLFVTLAVLVAGALAALPAAAGGSTTTLRNATGVSLQDAEFERENVAVVWQEPGESGQVVWVRTSTGAGTVFAPRELVARRARQASVDICGSSMFVAYAEDRRDGTNPNRWLIELATRGVSFTGFAYAGVSFGTGLARFPDVACAQRRLFVAWVERIGGDDRVRLAHALRSDLAFGAAIDLGLAPDPVDFSPPVVAAAGRFGYVAWQSGNAIRFRRWRTGIAPPYAPTAFAALTVGPGSSAKPAQHPIIGAEGDKVVVAWTRCADLFARVSIDRGASWGPIRKLADHPCPGEIGAYPNNVDIFGGSIAIEYSFIGPAGDKERVITSSSDLAGRTNTLLGSGADLQLFGYVTFPEAIGWQSARDVGPRLTYLLLGNTDPG